MQAKMQKDTVRDPIETTTNSKQIAGLVGPSLVVVTISEMLNAHIWATNTAPGIYLNGMFLFVAGLAIVRAHNRWVRGWSVVVTLVGWFVMLLGLLRMFAPELVLKGVQSTGPAFIAPTMGVLAIGIFLTFKAYRREGKQY